MQRLSQLFIPPKLARGVILTTLLLLFSATFSLSQAAVVSGTITSAKDGTPIIGATVVVEGTSIGAATDYNGAFTIPNAPDSGNFVVSYLGYQNATQPIVDGKSYTIKMAEDNKVIDEVVVVGYGTMRKKEVTGAVSRVDSESLTRISTSDLGTMLQGQIAGVSVQASSGEPGAASNVQIRGVSSISGSNDPLYVVDGVPQTSDPGLSANEIESVDVLKDAASAAIYGTRGAAGVILITTKKGKSGKMKVSFNGYYGVQKITSDMEMMDVNDYIYVSILKDQLTNGTTYDQAWTTLKTYNNNFFNNSNLYDVIINDYAPIQNYSVSASGGSEKITYSVMANYFSQEGVIINSNYERYNLRATLGIKEKKWTFNANLAIKNEDQQTPGYGLMSQSYSALPTSPQIDPEADYSQGSGSTSEVSSMSYVMARIKELNYATTNTYTANLMLGYDIMKGLNVSTRLGLLHANKQSKSINPLFEVYDSEGELVENSYTQSGIEQTSATNTNTTWETMLNWEKSFGKHEVKATGVFSLENYQYEYWLGSVKDLVNNEVPSLNLGTSDMLVSGGGNNQYTQDRSTSLIGMLARVQYNYDSKYMVSGSIRRDGSSRFAKENRWGVFPSLSAGWNISEEDFWKPVTKYISRAKLRASYGTTGNQNFADYSYQSIITQNFDYAYGSSGNEALVSGAAQSSFSNMNVKWETTVQTNVGVDLAFFRNSLTLSADVYRSEKNNMLFPLSIPPTNGTGSSDTMTLNVGDMRNQGIELATSYRNHIKKLWYNVNFTFSTNDNEITDMGGNSSMYYFSDGQPVTSDYSSDKVTAVKVGYEAGAFFVMPTDGVVNTATELAEYQKVKSDAQLGDLIYVDSNNDGVIDSSDAVYGGSGTPKFELGLNYSLNYKGFDLYMNWYSSLGNEIINGSKIYSMQSMTHPDLVYQWSENNPMSNIPAYRGASHDNYRSYADIWVQDGSFIRLKNISFGYSLPKKALSKMRLAKMRFYVAADNILTFTKYDGYDPEVGSNGLSRRGLDFGTYPIAAQLRGGVQIDF